MDGILSVLVLALGVFAAVAFVEQRGQEAIVYTIVAVLMFIALKWYWRARG